MIAKKFGKLLRSINKRIGIGSNNTPHFIRDYRQLVDHLTNRHGHENAMKLGVGGQWEETGLKEYQILSNLGLQAGDLVVDVGCGSGRLAFALAENTIDIGYHGCDIMQEFLDYASNITPENYRYTHVQGLTIPENDDAADFVAFFSVATHLLHHEFYIYLEEAKRVVKPKGFIIVSFLLFGCEDHWQPFSNMIEQTRNKSRGHLNSFIEPSAFYVWAEHQGLKVEYMKLPNESATKHGDDPRISGALDQIEIGQAFVVLSKP